MKKPSTVPFIIDGHLDLAINAMTLNRDLTQTVEEIRAKELRLGWKDYQDRGQGTVALPELRSGNIGLVLATMISRFSENGNALHSMALKGWHSPEQAFAHAQCQLAWYHEMEAAGEMVQITTKKGFTSHFDMWSENVNDTKKRPIGYILALEGADSIVNLDYLHKYHEQGLRSIGVSHFGPGRYAAGTHADGSGLTAIGTELLKEMNQLPIQLDLTHLTDKGFFEALDVFQGSVVASHQNCRSIVPGERQFSDDQIRCILERDGMLGGALDTWMLYPEFQLRKDDPKECDIRMESLVDHFDHICQLAGNSEHIGFGSDLDGLFGLEQTPHDMNTITDLQKFDEILDNRGYSQNDRNNIFFGNWARTLNKILT